MMNACIFIIRITLVALIAAFLGVGCARNNSRLLGAWISEPRETELGRAGMVIEFRTNGVFRGGMYWPQHANRSEQKESSYHVSGKQIISDAFVAGNAPEFCFEREELILKFDSEPAYRFKRR